MPLARLAAALMVVSIPLLDARADAGARETGRIEVERHRTSNALDGPVAIADWYTVLRGAIGHDLSHDFGSTRLQLELEVRRHDTIGIEDDHSIGLSMETTLRPSETLELRPTIFFRHTLEGDDFPIDDLIIGIRTPTSRAGAGLDAGIALREDLVLLLAAAATVERSGVSSFEADLIDPLQLNADFMRYNVSAGLRQTRDAFTYGVSARADVVTAKDEAALLPALSLSRYALRANLEWQQDGVSAGAALGMDYLRAEAGLADFLRPAFELALAAPLSAGIAVQTRLNGGFDLVDTDDALASYVLRGETELSVPISAVLALGAGAYRQRRENLAFGTTEDATGIFGKAEWNLTNSLSTYARIDYTRREIRLIDFKSTKVDAMVGLRASL
jgi:hypothetical protein